MKKLFLATSLFALFSGTTLAADTAVKSPAVAITAVPSWAGFYIGGHGGYGWKDDPFSEQVFTNLGARDLTVNGFKSRGWVAGGHVGYNWQYGVFVGGLELDLSATDINGSSATTTFDRSADLGAGAAASESRINDVKLLGTARGRVGWAPNSDWLLYGTGGLAWESLDRTSVFTETFRLGSRTTNSFSPGSFFGWVLGAGVEARLWSSNWIARLEYLHYDFGHTRSGNNTTEMFPVQTTVENNPVGNQTIDMVRAGLSYKFAN